MHIFSNTRRNSSCRNPMRGSCYHHNLNTPDDPSQFAYFSKILHHFEIKRGIELSYYSMGLLVRCRPPMISHWLFAYNIKISLHLSCVFWCSVSIKWRATYVSSFIVWSKSFQHLLGCQNEFDPQWTDIVLYAKQPTPDQNSSSSRRIILTRKSNSLRFIGAHKNHFKFSWDGHVEKFGKQQFFLIAPAFALRHMRCEMNPQ